MKQSQDRSMADRSKVSNEREPMSEKKGQFGASIAPMGIDMQGQVGSMSGYSHTAGGGMGRDRILNPTGIGEGEGSLPNPDEEKFGVPTGKDGTIRASGT
jgi:hypothetical protein